MSFDIEDKNSFEEMPNFHPPQDKDEEKELERWNKTSQGVWFMIKEMIEEVEGKWLWGEIKNVLLSNEKRLYDEYIE